jgi:hypothetical protein
MSKKNPRINNIVQKDRRQFVEEAEEQEVAEPFTQEELDRMTVDDVDMVYVCNCTSLNVRQAPNKDAKVAFIVPVDTVFIRDSSNGAWSHVVTDDNKKRMGWVMNAFIREVE